MRRFRVTTGTGCAAVLLSLVPEASGQSGDYVESFLRGSEALQAGELPLAARLFEECRTRWNPNPVLSFHLACVAARMGDVDGALSHLEDAARRGYADAEVALFEPDLEALRGRPRFTAVVDDMRVRRRDSLGGERAAEIDYLWPGPPRDFSADGTRAVTSKGFVMDELSGEVLANLGGPVLRSEPRFSPDGSTLVTTHPGGILRVWDARERSSLPLLHELAGLPDAWSRISFDATGDRLLHSTSERVRKARARILRPRHGVWERTLPQPCDAFSLLAPDGEAALLIGNVHGRSMFPGEQRTESLVQLVRTGTGETIVSWRARRWLEYTGSFSQDGRFAVAVGLSQGRGFACITFDVEKGELFESLPAAEEDVRRAVFSHGSMHLITAGGDGRLVWWELPSLVRGRSIQAHEGAVESFRSNADGTLLFTWGADGFVRCWSTEAGTKLWERELGRPHELTVIVDGDQVGVPLDDRGVVLESRTGRRKDRPQRDAISPGQPTVHPLESATVVPCSDGTVRVVDLATGSERPRLATGVARVGGVEFGPRGRRIVCLGREEVELFDAPTGALVARHELASQDYRSLQASFRPDGEVVAIWGGASPALLVDAATGERRAVLHEQAGVVRRAAWSPGGAVLALAESKREHASTSEGGAATLRDGETGAVKAELAHPGSVTGVAFSPDGERLATASTDGYARIWEWRSGSVLQTLAHDDIFGREMVYTVQFSPDGRRLISTTGTLGQTWSWNLETSERMWKVMNSGGPSEMHALLSRDGSLVYISGDMRETSGIVDAEDGRRIVHLRDVGADRFAAAGDFERLVTTGDGAVRVFDGSSLDLLFSWIPFEGDGYVSYVPSHHFRCTADVARRARLRVDGVTYPLDTFAAVLLDPKRVRAGAHGVPVSPARLPDPPTLRLIAPRERIVVARGSVTIEAIAGDPREVAAIPIDVERDGRSLDAARLRAATTPSEDGKSARLVLTVQPLAGEPETSLRLRAVGASGVSSLPAILTIRWQP